MGIRYTQKAFAPHHREYDRRDVRSGKMLHIRAKGSPSTDMLFEKVKRLGHGEGREVPLTRDELTAVLNTGKFALVSAGPNPEFPDEKLLTEKEIKERHKRLGERLKDGGFAFTKVVGHYGDKENSYLIMVHDADRDYVRMLGKEFKQDSVIYGEKGRYELHYTTGEKAAKKEMVEGEGWDEITDLADYYTEFPHPDGATTKFRLRLNFAEPKQARKGFRMTLDLSKIRSRRSLSEETNLKKDMYLQKPAGTSYNTGGDVPPPKPAAPSPTRMPTPAAAVAAATAVTKKPTVTPVAKAVSADTEHEVGDPAKDHTRHLPVVTRTPVPPPALPVEEKRDGLGRKPAKGEGDKKKPASKEKSAVKKKPKPKVEKAMTTVSASPMAAKQPPAYLPGVHSPSSPVRKPKGLLKPKVKKCNIKENEVMTTKDPVKGMQDIFKSTVFVADSNDQPHDGGSGQVEPSRAGAGAKENDDIAPLLKGLKDATHGDAEEYLITKSEMAAMELDVSDLDGADTQLYTITKGELSRLGKSEHVKMLADKKAQLLKSSKPQVQKSNVQQPPAGFTPRAGGVHDPRGQELVQWSQGTDQEVAKYIEKSGGIGYGQGDDESIRTQGPGDQ